jgi:hypothetical protein
VPGIDREQGPPTTVAKDEELRIDDTFLGIESTMKARDEVKEGELVIGDH